MSEDGHTTAGRRIIQWSWISNALFLAGSLPLALGAHGTGTLAAGICLALFGASLVVWVWAFVIAASRSSPG